MYKITLPERLLLNGDILAPFDSKMVVRKGDCANGDVVYCADGEFSTNPLEAGDYYVWVDSAAETAKGNFNLEFSRTAAVLPANDTCENVQGLEFADSIECDASHEHLLA